MNIGVIGGHKCSGQIASLAREIGGLIAKEGWVLVCGGGGGVMEAACRGAKEFDGLTVGILPGYDKSMANKYIDVLLPTGFGYGRNIFIVRASDILVALGGSYGTLSEIAFALSENKTVFSLKSWDIKGVKKMKTPYGVIKSIKRRIKYEQ